MLPRPTPHRGLLPLLAGLTLSAVLTALPASARTLDTAYGKVEIDGAPVRVVTLYEGALDTALAAGVTPLAAVATRGGDSVARYLQGRVGNIAIVGTARETNIEAVVAQAPDVILASSQLPEAQYRLLSQVAPTLVPQVTRYQPDSWKQEARFYAQALGRESAVNTAIAGIESRAATLADDPATQASAGLVRWMPQGALVMAPGVFASTLLDAAGFHVDGGDLVKEGRPHSDALSLENLSRIDSDWLFLATLNAEGGDALAAAKTSPAFERLDVVKRDRVVAVDGQLWTSASGPLAAGAILDDIEAAIAKD